MENLEFLTNLISDIISDEVYLRYVPYSMRDGDMEKDPESVRDAATMIVKMLVEQGYLK